MSLDPMEQARADLYRLLAAALSHPPTTNLLHHLQSLPIAQEPGPIGEAITGVARAAQSTTLQAAQREYDRLFVGIARGELMPYASFYLTGFLHDRPLARLRADLQALGLAAAANHPDPEDHAGTLCEIMAWLIDTHPLAAQRRFFERHLAPWLDRFFTDLEHTAEARLYPPIGTLGRVFCTIEHAAFELETL